MHPILFYFLFAYSGFMNDLADIKGTRTSKNKKKNRRKDQAKDLSSKNANENNKVRLCYLIKYLFSIYCTTYFIRLVSSFCIAYIHNTCFKKKFCFSFNILLY